MKTDPKDEVARLWAEHSEELGDANQRNVEATREMEDALFDEIPNEEADEKWNASEETQRVFAEKQTEVRDAFQKLGIPVTYIGDEGITLADGTSLRYPRPVRNAR